MDTESIRLLVTGLTIALGVLGPALAVGMIGKSAMDALGRNPEAESQVRTAMILAIAFAESIAIFTLVVALIIKFV